MSKLFRILSILLLTFFSIHFAVADGMRKEEDDTMNVVDHDDPLAVTETVIERHKGTPAPATNNSGTPPPADNSNSNTNSQF